MVWMELCCTATSLHSYWDFTGKDQHSFSPSSRAGRAMPLVNVLWVSGEVLWTIGWCSHGDSPFSPVIANIYMEHFEDTALRTAPLQPTHWLRYVCDTFVIWPQGQDELQRFHDHINQQHPNIQFTIEEEREGKLTFLDVVITRSPDGLSTSMYCKPTHTDRYIPFTLTITREQPLEYWGVCVTEPYRSAASHWRSLN